MNQLTQKEFNTLPLFLSEKADHEIDFINDMVVGVVYIAIGSEDSWVGIDFKANFTKSYTKGELWKDGYGVHCIETPSCKVDDIGNIGLSYSDSGDVDNEELYIDYKARIDDIYKIVLDFIYAQELPVESKYIVYNTYNV